MNESKYMVGRRCEVCRSHSCAGSVTTCTKVSMCRERPPQAGFYLQIVTAGCILCKYIVVVATILSHNWVWVSLIFYVHLSEFCVCMCGFGENTPLIVCGGVDLDRTVD